MSSGLQQVSGASQSLTGVLSDQNKALAAASAAIGDTNPTAKVAIDEAIAANGEAQQYANGIGLGVAGLQTGIGPETDMSTGTINGRV